MGYEDYQAYLLSDLWRSIRARVYGAYGTRCGLCKDQQAEVIHHLRYSKDVLLGDNLKQLVPLCGACHHDIEFNGDLKRSVPDARDEYYRRLLGYDGWAEEQRRREEVRRGKQKKRVELRQVVQEYQNRRCERCGQARKKQKNRKHCRKCCRETGIR